MAVIKMFCFCSKAEFSKSVYFHVVSNLLEFSVTYLQHSAFNANSPAYFHMDLRDVAHSHVKHMCLHYELKKHPGG